MTPPVRSREVSDVSVSMQAPPPLGHDVPTPPEPPRRHPRRWGWWVVLVAVVVVGAVAVVAVLLLRTAAPVAVSGTVLDARTGIGVRDVTVSGGLELATSDAEGAFQVEARPDVVLGFTAPGYEGSQAAATATMMVELEPVVLTGTVTSAMTGGGLYATVTRDGAELGAAAEDGVLTVYAASPGDQLVVQAAGYQPAEVTVGSGDLIVELQPQFATSQAQIQRWVAAGKFGKALGWVLRRGLDVSLVTDSMGQQITDEVLGSRYGRQVFAAGRSMTPMGSNDVVDAYVVKQGQAGAAMDGWIAETGVVTFRVEGQRFATGPHWDDSDTVVMLWWYDPILVLTFADTEDEAEVYLTAVLRGQGLDINSLGRGGNDQAAVQPAAVALSR